jgi:hypothetical protein
MEERFCNPIVQGQGLALMHKQLLGNQSVEYPRQGLCTVTDAPFRAMCGRPTT